MITLEMDMVQYDCPYIDTTVDHDVSFFTKQWDFDTETQSLETRIVVGGRDRPALNRGLDALSDHPNMHGYELLRRKDDKAFIRSEIGQTNAMKVIRENDGYITGPFRIKEGSETWHIGFDTESTAADALSELERHNDFEVESRDEVGIDEYYDVMQNRAVAKDLLDACRDLSRVEAETLESAVRDGYFSDPRGATLSSFADEFDVSKMAVSKNLRRSQRKVLDEVVDAMNRLED
jgi:predicted DNA binding protein